MGAHLLPFLALSALIIVAPGPDTALVVRNTLVGGRRAGIATSVGTASGLFVWTLAASLGVAALLRASEPAFLALRLAGGAYLVYLGVRALWTAVRGDGDGSGVARGRWVPWRVSLRQGVLSNLSNPKIAVFFTSFLPQFVPDGNGTFFQLLALGLIFCVMTFVWLVGYVLVVVRVGDVLRRGRIHRALEAVTGTFLVGFGLRLATERR
ncbi:MAG TPA: LysE family translocator [Gaiellaceae bacterium]|nr:LysE family translocator [Gaiellaceae bacterium]